MNDYLKEAFLEQDYKNYNYDAIFYVDGKELFAHRDVLASASSVFKKLFKKNRPTRDDPINRPIQIDGYSYDEFYEFLRLIYYIDNNDVEDENLNTIIELADFYKVNEISKAAGKQLIECGGFYVAQNEEELDDEDIKDIFERIEFAHKFSLLKDLRNMEEFLDNYFNDLIGYNGFNNLDESAIKAFVFYVVKNGGYASQHEDLCKAIYKWGEYQAMITVEMPKEEKKELVLHYIKDVLPLFNFRYLSPKFLFKFAVPRGLISIDEANIYGRIEVSVICNRNSISGTFVDCYGIFEVIESHEEEDENRLVDRGEKKRCFWDKTFKKPSKPSELKKMKGCEWYLAIDRNGKLNLKHQSLIKRTDYLIAEMKTSNENGAAFTIDENYNVYATVSRK